MYVLEATVEPPMGSGLYFGGTYNGAVSLSNNRMAVGAWGTANSAGSAAVLSRSGGSWTLDALLTPNTSAASQENAFFGLSLALSGDRLVVGAPNDQMACKGSSYCGAVYVYHTNALRSWSQTQWLTDHVPQSVAIFGWSVALRGDTLAVGSYGIDGYTGRVIIFSFDTFGYAKRTAILTAGDGVPGDNFGFSVALSQDALNLVIGASRADGVRGAAYVFSRGNITSTAWAKLTRLTDASGEPGDRFGTSCAVDSTSGSGESFVLCGSKHKSSGGFSHNGAALLYNHSYNHRPAATIDLLQVLVPPSGDGALNGGSVALSDATAVVGPYGAGCYPMPGETCAAQPDQGKVFIYHECQTLSGCVLAQTIAPPLSATPGAVTARFGAGVFLDGSSLAISAPSTSVNDNSTLGVIYVYRWDSATAPPFVMPTSPPPSPPRSTTTPPLSPPPSPHLRPLPPPPPRLPSTPLPLLPAPFYSPPLPSPQTESSSPSASPSRPTVSVEYTLDATISSFSEDVFRRRLASFIGIDASDIATTVVAASIRVVATITTSSAESADAVARTLDAASESQLGARLGTAVLSSTRAAVIIASAEGPQQSDSFDAVQALTVVVALSAVLCLISIAYLIISLRCRRVCRRVTASPHQLSSTVVTSGGPARDGSSERGGLSPPKTRETL